MSSELFFLSQNFYKLAGAQDLIGQFDWLENRLKMEDSWDGVTELSTPRIFYQELKDKPGEHKDKIRIVKTIFNSRQELSKWRLKALETLHDENFFLLFPNSDVIGELDMFRRQIKRFGGSKVFSDEHLQKIFRAFKIYTLLYEQFKIETEINLKLYAELIYVPKHTFFSLLNNKLEKKKNYLQKTLTETNFRIFSSFNLLLEKMKIKNNIGSKIEIDHLKDEARQFLTFLLEKEDNYNSCLKQLQNYLQDIFYFSTSASDWNLISYNIRMLYVFDDYPKILKIQSIQKKLNNTESVTWKECLEMDDILNQR